MNTPNIKLIALDLDGTLENSQHVITPRTQAAVAAAQAQGMTVIIATGKTYYSGRQAREKLGLSTPSVHAQGLMVYAGDGSILYERDLSAEILREVVDAAAQFDADVIAYSRGRTLATERNAHTSVLEKYGEPPLTVVADLLDAPAQKLIAVADPAQIVRLRAVLAEQLAERASLVQANLTNMLEILPIGASKGDGVQRVLDHLGLDSAEMLAIGDGENDIEMLQMAAIGVAMGNAGQHVKDSADFVTASNDEDGVALAIEKFVLKR